MLDLLGVALAERSDWEVRMQSVDTYLQRSWRCSPVIPDKAIVVSLGSLNLVCGHLKKTVPSV
jgi:hypothetical protein